MTDAWTAVTDDAKVKEGVPLAVYPRGLNCCSCASTVPCTRSPTSVRTWPVRSRAARLEGYVLTCPCHDWSFDVRSGVFTLAGEIAVATYPDTGRRRQGRGRPRGDGVMAAASVKLWALSTCPWCRKTKQWFTAKGVDFEFVDVDLLSDGEYDAIDRRAQDAGQLARLPDRQDRRTRCSSATLRPSTPTRSASSSERGGARDEDRVAEGGAARPLRGRGRRRSASSSVPTRNSSTSCSSRSASSKTDHGAPYCPCQARTRSACRRHADRLSLHPLAPRALRRDETLLVRPVRAQRRDRPRLAAADRARRAGALKEGDDDGHLARSRQARRHRPRRHEDRACRRRRGDDLQRRRRVLRPSAAAAAT